LEGGIKLRERTTMGGMKKMGEAGGGTKKGRDHRATMPMPNSPSPLPHFHKSPHENLLVFRWEKLFGGLLKCRQIRIPLGTAHGSSCWQMMKMKGQFWGMNMKDGRRRKRKRRRREWLHSPPVSLIFAVSPHTFLPSFPFPLPVKFLLEFGVLCPFGLFAFQIRVFGLSHRCPIKFECKKKGQV
jgi:hypothetical protein